VVLEKFIETSDVITTNFKEIGSIERGTIINNVYGPNIIARKVEFLELL